MQVFDSWHISVTFSAAASFGAFYWPKTKRSQRDARLSSATSLIGLACLFVDALVILPAPGAWRCSAMSFLRADWLRGWRR